MVVADIFGSSNKLLPGTDTAAKNGLTAAPTSGPTYAKAIDTGVLNHTAANDTGIIASNSEITVFASNCNTYVTCKNGLDISDSTGGTTCYDSCVASGESLCCAYTDVTGATFNACSGFTGKVCMDGSCNGFAACQDAMIPSVVNSCIGGQVCYNAGSEGGSIEKVSDSCKGTFACNCLGFFNGKVGNVLNACNFDGACSHAAYKGGIIGSISDSCNEDNGACGFLGFKYGTVGNVLNSCNGYRACFGGASSGGSIGSITISCNCKNACEPHTSRACFLHLFTCTVQLVHWN